MAQGFPTFPEFFTAVTGHDPHDWQIELAERIQSGGWPARIEMPTGLGKTAAILVAVYDLARQLHHGLPRTAPQRIFHVVNRRTLVDGAHGFVRMLAERVNDGAHDPHVAPVREALRRLLGPGDDLTIATGSIHGDTPRDVAWLRATGCSIVTLTPHQFVSRLLMRGFAVTPSRRPIDAGLAGVDRLVLFDEPHLAIPAVQTILDAERLQARATEPLGVPLGCTVLLGATLPSALTEVMDRDSVLRLEAVSPSAGSGRRGASLADRLLHARRRVHLERVKSSSDVNVAKAMAARAVAAADGGRAVVVFTNTVALAQRVHRLLVPNPAGPVHLITSRFRPLDRGEIDASAGITVTTQCLEVGVDMSFGTLVTEAASWDALVQRLGRLNRYAELDWADAHLIAGTTGSVRAGTKAIYGEETVQAALELFELAERESPDGIDASPAALAALRRRGEAQLLDGASPRAATLHSGLAPLMTHTRPTPSPDLPVEAFVAGPDHPVNREIEVAWRDRVDALDDASFGDVYAAETVSVPRSALARLLRGDTDDRDRTPIADVADMVVDEAALRGFLPKPALEALRVWDGGTERWRVPRSLDDVLRADRVVLPSQIGGYQADLGWTGDGGRVEDLHFVAALGFLAAAAGDRRCRQLNLSLSQSVVEQVLHRPQTSPSLAALAASRPAEPDTADSDLPPAIEPTENSPLRELWNLLADLAAADEASLDLVVEAVQRRLPQALSRVLTVVSGEAATNPRARIEGIDGLADGPGARAVLCTVTMPERRHVGVTEAVSLDLHLKQVGAWAERDGRAAGLSEAVVAALGTAGRWHDVGKAYPPFQRYFVGCPSAKVTAAGVEVPEGARHPLLAKPLADVAEETRSSWAADREARTAAGLAAGFRHEAASVAAFCDSHADELTEHLIGSHHGWYRPVAPPLPDVQLAGYAHADDFAMLNNRFGPWGLAYLEAVLRLADWRASAHPDGAGAKPPVEGTPPSVELRLWDELLRRRPGSVSVTGAESHALTGLVTHPLTGWFASVGLLAAAVDAGDDAATLCWESWEQTPQVPVLTTRLPLRDVVSWAFDRKAWVEANALVADVLGRDDMNLRKKNQKLAPAAGLRGVLLRSEAEAPARLLLGLLGDAAKAGAGGQVELPIVAFANNSSYPKVALDFLERATAIDDCLRALTDVNLGYTTTACDGGMDRPRAAAPLVNGLGAPGDERSVRTALAPLALYGMGRLGNTGAAALGVIRSAGRPQLQLPLPTEPATLAALRSMTISIRSPRSWSWSAIGGEWTYSASREYLSDRKTVDIIWSGRVVPRGEAKPNEKRPSLGRQS